MSTINSGLLISNEGIKKLICHCHLSSSYLSSMEFISAYSNRGKVSAQIYLKPKRCLDININVLNKFCDRFANACCQFFD